MTLPDEMHRYLTKATRGQLEVKVRGVQEGARAVYAVGRQIIYTAVGLFFTYEGLQARGAHDVGLEKVCFCVAAVAGILLLGSSLFARPGRGR